MRLKNADPTSISKDLALQALEMASGEFVLLLEGETSFLRALSEMVPAPERKPKP